MAKSWKELAAEIEKQTRNMGATCPDEIKRFHYGLITHSEAGKHQKNQYFGHWTHAYASCFIYSMDILPSIGRLAANPDFGLKQAKQLFCDISQSGNVFILAGSGFGGQKGLAKYIQAMIDVFDTVQTKEEFIELLDAFGAYVARLWLWFHWYFPWGLGPAVFQRIETEDLQEMLRLSQTS